MPDPIVPQTERKFRGNSQSVHGYKTREWYLILIPGIAIFITVTLLNLVGEGLRDALDPKMRK